MTSGPGVFEHMPSRIGIIGNCGSGKSHLAAAMAVKWHLPVVELDRLFWMPRSFTAKRPPDLVQAEVAVKKAEPAWIVEGVFGDLASLVLDRAELLVWLDLDWETCRTSLVRRGFAHPDAAAQAAMAASFDRLLAWGEAYWHRDTHSSHRGHGMIYENFSGAKQQFRSRAAVDAFIADLRPA